MGKKADELVEDLKKHCEELRRQKKEVEQLREQANITINQYEWEIKELEQIIKRRVQHEQVGNCNECGKRRQADIRYRAHKHD